MQLLEAAVQLSGEALARVRAAGEFKQAVALLAAQIHASGQAVQLLCIAGRANQAHPIARAMVEHAINASYIARQPAVRAKRFWAHRAIAHAQAMEARQPHVGVSAPAPLREQVEDAKKILAPHKHWDAGVRLRARADECGLRALYDIYYPGGSAFSHGDASMLDAFLGEDGSSMQFGPSADGLESVAGAAIAALFAALFMVCRVFDDRQLDRDLVRLGGLVPEHAMRIDMREHFEVVRRSIAETEKDTP